MTEVQLISYVRSKCGGITSNMGELDDTDITSNASWILQKLEERITVRKIKSITSVKNQREYDVSSSTLRVQEILPWDACAEKESMVLGGYETSEIDANENYNFPSLWKIRMMKRMRGLANITCDFDPINRKIRIDPAPDEGGKKYWYVSIEKSQWTLEKVPPDFEDMVVTGVSWRCLNKIALKRSRLGGIQRSGGMVDYPEARLESFIERWKKEFFDELNIKAKLYSR